MMACIGVMLLAARMTSFEGFGTVNNFVVLPVYFISGTQFLMDRAPQ